jgi:hypothetical protein
MEGRAAARCQLVLNHPLARRGFRCTDLPGALEGLSRVYPYLSVSESWSVEPWRGLVRPSWLARGCCTDSEGAARIQRVRQGCGTDSGAAESVNQRESRPCAAGMQEQLIAANERREWEGIEGGRAG